MLFSYSWCAHIFVLLLLLYARSHFTTANHSSSTNSNNNTLSTSTSTSININAIAVLPFDFEHCLLDLSLTELLRLKKSLNGITIAQTGLEINDEQLRHTHTSLMMSKGGDDVSNHSDGDGNSGGDGSGDGNNNGIEIDCQAKTNCERPIALALVNNNNNNNKNDNSNSNNNKQDRGGYITKPVHTTYHHYHHPWQAEEKPSKLQTLFQISITALAFLSFGGYLLCLIVQAIKSKGTTYFHPVATATTAMMNGTGVRRIKIYRRSRRSMPATELPYAFWAAQHEHEYRKGLNKNTK